MQRIVFLHGLCGCRTFFNKYYYSLKDDYLIETYDLPGHGNAPTCEPEYFREESVKYLNTQLKQSDYKTTIVAHSISGEIAHLLSLEAQFNLKHIIFLDSCYPSQTVKKSWNETAIKAMSSNTPTDFYTNLFKGYLSNNCDPLIKQTVINTMLKIPTEWTSKVLKTTKVFDKEKKAKCHVSIIESYDSFSKDIDYSWAEVYPTAKLIKTKLPKHFYFLENFNETLNLLKVVF